MDYLEISFILQDKPNIWVFIILLVFFFFSQGTVSSFLPGLSNHVFLHILANSLYPIPGLHNLLLTITVGILPEQEQLEKKFLSRKQMPWLFSRSVKRIVLTLLWKRVVGLISSGISVSLTGPIPWVKWVRRWKINDCFWKSQVQGCKTQITH